MRVPLPIVGPKRTARSIVTNPQRCVNLYPVPEGPGAKHAASLYPTPGTTLAKSIATGAVRSNGVEFGDAMYWAAGAALYKVDSSLTSTSVGALVTSAGWVSIAAGRAYLMLVDGAKGYVWDGVTFAQITDPDFPANPTSVTYLDGYFIVASQGSDQFTISANEDPTAWNALDFASAAADPDDLLAVAATHQDLYALGARTTEIYYDSGAADFPFTRHANGVIELGLEAVASVALAEGTLFFLARTDVGGKLVVMISGFTPRVISDDDIVWEIGGLTATDDAEGFVYRQVGQTFYVLTFPAANRTFIYHVEAGVWHERTSPSLARWRARGHCYFGGAHYVGDYTAGKLYELDTAVYTEDGSSVTRTRRTTVSHADRRRIQVNSVEVEFEAGVGLTSGQGSDPQAMLRYSRDDGKTWSRELWRPIGKRGEYGARAIWNRLGVGRGFVFEISISDPVPVAILGGYADVQVLDS